MSSKIPSYAVSSELTPLEQHESQDQVVSYRTAASQIAEQIINQQEGSVSAQVDLNVVEEFALHASLFRWVREASRGTPEHSSDRQIAKEKITECWKVGQINPGSKAATQLNLTGLNLSRLPETIGQLKCLKVLNLSHNDLQTLPRSLSNLQNLEELNLNSNGFNHIPDVVFKLGGLKWLSMDDNHILLER